MARHLCFAIALIATGMSFNTTAGAVTDAVKCEDRAANCVGRCINPGGGTNENKCMWSCNRRVTACLIRVHDAIRRW